MLGCSDCGLGGGLALVLFAEVCKCEVAGELGTSISVDVVAGVVVDMGARVGVIGVAGLEVGKGVTPAGGVAEDASVEGKIVWDGDIPSLVSVQEVPVDSADVEAAIVAVPPTVGVSSVSSPSV